MVDKSLATTLSIQMSLQLSVDQNIDGISYEVEDVQRGSNEFKEDGLILVDRRAA